MKPSRFFLRPTISNARLTPFAEVTKAQTANLDQATADLTNASPSVIILSDVGRISGSVAERLRGFVEKGGMLIRFAGPRLEQGGDALLPAPLREGGRTLGGAMTWASPQTPAPLSRARLSKGLPSRRMSRFRGKCWPTRPRCRERPRSGRGLLTARLL